MISFLIFSVASDTCFAATCAKSPSVGLDLLRGGRRQPLEREGEEEGLAFM